MQKERIKFIHIADMHLDAWREKELKRLNFLAFKKIVDESIDRKVDFLLISGDLLHVSIPSLNAIRFLTKELRRLKEHSIKVFAIPGSHDLSSDENSFLYVLEEAGLLSITSKAEIHDGKISLVPTEYHNVVIYGMLGRKGGLDKEYYKKIGNLKDFGKYKNSYKIFQLHIGINEILPTELKIPQNISVNDLPKGFDYYAAGHIHTPVIKSIRDVTGKEGYVVYPGPVYPDNFSELEELRGDSHFIYVEVERSDSGEWITNIHHETFRLYDVESIDINCDGLTPQQIHDKTIELLKGKEITNKIVLLKFHGVIEGLISNINFKEIEKFCSALSPYIVKRNTFKLQSKMYESDIKIETQENIVEMENELLKELFKNTGKYDFDSYTISKILVDMLSESKNENETKDVYYRRVIQKCANILLENFKNRTLFDMTSQN